MLSFDNYSDDDVPDDVFDIQEKSKKRGSNTKKGVKKRKISELLDDENITISDNSMSKFWIS